ncbi:MAG: PD40 domain-containing protein [Ardenticatenaceae bacterium]|nr:PD40 domain-containing protein [Ardenticatenaceae bacterium]
MAPFPTVTPDYVEYETKPIFIALIGCCGDGGSETDDVMGRDTPMLIIYGDGQIVVQEWAEHTRTFLQAYLSPQEMCLLRQQIASTGFLEPHDTFFTERDGSMGVGSLLIQVEDTYYSFYGGDVRFLVEDLNAGYQLIRNFRPQAPLTPYIPNYLVLWLEEIEPRQDAVIQTWPSNLPAISELWANREQETILIEGELVAPIFDLFDYQNKQALFRDGDTVYAIIARPLLPHETPRHYPTFSGLPRDYAPVLNCDGEASLISSAIPTATPTLTASATNLVGQGRILFVSGSYSNQEIYVIEADGTNRQRLTNNLFADDEPVWSPDGRHIAFVSNRTGNQDIFVMDADGSHVVQLTTHEYDDYSPTWSPDGSQIAFISDRDGGWEQSEIYVMNADGSQQQRLTQNTTRDLFPTWSPDGLKIAYVKASALGILYLNAPEPMEEWISGRIVSRPAWSSDSLQIAVPFAPNLNEAGIRFVNLDGTESQTVSVLPLQLPTSLDWSADGRFLIFAARVPNEGDNSVHYSEDTSYLGNWGIFALNMATGEVIQITFMEQDELSPTFWP